MACANKKEIILKIDNAQGLSSGCPVVINGLEVGEVTDLSFDESYKILVKISLEKEIPDDSKFILGSSGLLGGPTLEIRSGNSKNNFKGGEIVTGSINKSPTFLDTLETKVANSIEGFLNAKKKPRFIINRVKEVK
jgi:ABC-type transporter Mla subunit MlaD